MAHFVELDDNNVVIRGIVVNNSELMENGVESETKGIAFCQSLFGGRWIQTSYNRSFRKHYAGEGWSYDPIRDAFIPPQPFASWTLDEEELTWHSPVPYPVPSNGKLYSWNEADQKWDEVN